MVGRRCDVREPVDVASALSSRLIKSAPSGIASRQKRFSTEIRYMEWDFLALSGVGTGLTPLFGGCQRREMSRKMHSSEWYRNVIGRCIPQPCSTAFSNTTLHRKVRSVPKIKGERNGLTWGSFLLIRIVASNRRFTKDQIQHRIPVTIQRQASEPVTYVLSIRKVSKFLLTGGRKKPQLLFFVSRKVA